MGEVHFKDIAYKDLNRRLAPKEQVSSRFRAQRLDEFYRSWSAAVADVNRDGIPDVVAGPLYYLGPDYTEAREIYISETYNPSTEYARGCMVNFAYDFTGDGWPEESCATGNPTLETLQPLGQKALPASPRDPQPDGPEAGHEVALIVAIAVLPRLPPTSPIAIPTSKAVPQPLRVDLEKPFPRLPCPPVQITPEALLQLAQEVLELLRNRYNLCHGCKSPFEAALACQAKANLHPLAFYTIEVTSPEASNKVLLVGHRFFGLRQAAT
jgi:hypothetical protein